MADFNKVILHGRVTAAPEMKTTSTGKFVTSFSLAVNRRFSKEAVDFLTVTAWDKTAEYITKFGAKGRPLLVCGAIQTRTWQDKEGNKRTAVEIIADEASYTDNFKPSGNSEGSKTAQTNNYAAGYAESGKFEEVSTDEDFPF